MLAGLGLRYGSDEATDFSVNIHKTLAIEAYKASTTLQRKEVRLRYTTQNVRQTTRSF